MTTYFVGPGGNDGNSGLTWALRLLTLNGAEDKPVVAGDVVYVGPGVYREQLTCDVSGGNTYTTGTVTVTQGSDQVTGSGTTWVGNVAAGYWFHVRRYLYGTDGVTNGTSTFTSAAGNFHANLIGMPIQISTKGAYTISAVASATSMTLADPNALGWPTAGSGLTYSCMTGEGHYEIESVDDNTTITLCQPWQGPTHSGLSYITFNAITYIADITGAVTDGVGGVVRITGSDNDTTTTRAYCISIPTRNYRIFRGFRLDLAATKALYMTTVSHIVCEDLTVLGDEVYAIDGLTGSLLSFRRIVATAGAAMRCFNFLGDVIDVGIVFENCMALPAQDGYGWAVTGGGSTIRNCLILGGDQGARHFTSATVGQCSWIINCIVIHANSGLRANTLGDVIADYIDFRGNTTNLNNIGVGANNVTYPPLFDWPILYAGADELSGFKIPWRFGQLSQWSAVRAIAGFGGDERNTDLYGIRRPITTAKNSWGPVQYQDARWETTTVQAGTASRKLADATRKQYVIPVTAVSTTISVYVRRETNYSGTLPQMVIKQPGVADRVTTDTGSADSWNLLTDTFTPDSGTDYVVVELVSNNTATSGSYAVYFDTLTVN